MSKQFVHIRTGLSQPGLASDPSDPADGDLYFNTTLQAFRAYQSGAWITLGSGAPVYSSFSLSNNQSSPANVTGAIVSHASNNAFSMEYSILITATGASQPFSENSSFYTNLGTAFNSDILALAPQSNSQLVVAGAFSTFDGNSRGRIVRLNADGTEDTTFATNTGSGFGGIGDPMATVIQNNGQILVGGAYGTFNGNSRVSLVRLNSDGTEDTSFYSNLGSGFNSQVNALALQSNQQILVGGNFTGLNGNTRNHLVRLNTDGTEDTTFYTNLGSGFGSNIYSIAVQSNGQILVGGSFTTFNGNTRHRLVRLNSDGTEDTTFYTNLSGGFTGTVTALAILSNNEIVAAGSFTSFGGNTRNYIVCLTTTGTEDTTFYTNYIGSGSGLNNAVYALATEGAQVLVGGAFTSYSGNTRNSLIRLNNDGTEDTTFYTDISTGFNNQVLALATSGSDPTEIYAGGLFTSWNGNTRNYITAFNDAYTLPSVELVSQGTLRGTYMPGSTTWALGGQTSLAPEGDPGIVFSMTSSGQLQYTSTNISGTSYAGTLRYLLNLL